MTGHDGNDNCKELLNKNEGFKRAIDKTVILAKIRLHRILVRKGF